MPTSNPRWGSRPIKWFGLAGLLWGLSTVGDHVKGDPVEALGYLVGSVFIWCLIGAAVGYLADQAS